MTDDARLSELLELQLRALITEASERQMEVLRDWVLSLKAGADEEHRAMSAETKRLNQEVFGNGTVGLSERVRNVQTLQRWTLAGVGAAVG